MVKLERDGVKKMLLLVGGQGVKEELRLVIVLLEFLSADALLDAFNFRGISGAKLAVAVNYTTNLRIVSALLRRNRWKDLLAVGPVIDVARSDAMSHLSVTLVIENGTNRSIDGKLLTNERVTFHKHAMINIPPASSRPDEIAGCQSTRRYDLEGAGRR
jgi:hypothetical protein